MRILLLLLLCLHGGWAEECCTVPVRTPDKYVYIPVALPSNFSMANVTSISFSVKTCHDAHLALSTSTRTSELDTGVSMYEIVIGGWANTQSVLRKSKQGPNLAVRRRHRPVACHHFRRFYVRWKEGVVEVGEQREKGEKPGWYSDQPAFLTYTDPAPFTVHQLFVSGWGCQGGVWRFDIPCQETQVPEQESATVHMRTPDKYQYIPVVVPDKIRMSELTSISFSVKTCHDAHLALSTSTRTSELDTGVSMYEIVIGGWANTQSVLRKSKQGPNLAVRRRHRPVACHHFRRFYVRWKEGVVEVGEQREKGEKPGWYSDQPAFLTYTDPAPFTVNQLFVSGWAGQGSTWEIEFPAGDKLEPQPGLMLPEHSPSSAEVCHVNIRTPDSYAYIPVATPPNVHMKTVTSISFSVKTCHDAHLALSTSTRTSELDTGVSMYEIVIGGWANTQSVLRKSKQGPNLAVRRRHRPVACRHFRRFYVRWKEGVVEVGEQREKGEKPGWYSDQPAFLTYTDPAPFTVHQLFVSGWAGQDGTWNIDFPCHEKPTPKSDSCGVDMQTPDSYKYVPVLSPPHINITNLTSISFSVKTCHDAHLALSTSTRTSELDTGVSMYEIVIGGWANTQSVLRKSKQGPNLAVRRRHRPVACHHFRRFYVRWKEGVVEVGEQREKGEKPGWYSDQPAFLTYTDPAPFTVNQLFVSGWGCQGGVWRFDFPCGEEQEPKPDLSYDIKPLPDKPCTLAVRTPNTYTYIPVTAPKDLHLDAPYISIAVNSSGEVYLALSSSGATTDLDKGIKMYEIVLGASNSTSLAIRGARQGKELALVNHTWAPNPDHLRRFFVRWGEGLLEVGEQREDEEYPGYYVDEMPFLSYEDPSPFSINQIFVSGGIGQRSWWQVAFPCTVEPPPDRDMFAETCTRHISPLQQQQNAYVAVRPPPTSPRLSYLHFSLKSCRDARLLLSHHGSQGKVGAGEEVYEVILGADSNTASVLSTRLHGERVTIRVKHSPLSCTQPRLFYLSWAKGQVEVGSLKEDPQHPGSYVEEPPFLVHERRSNFPIGHVFTSGWKGEFPAWEFVFPCYMMPHKAQTDAEVEKKTHGSGDH